MNPDVKLQKLKEMLSLLNDGLTREEFTSAFKEVIKSIKALQDDLISKIDKKLAKSEQDSNQLLQEMRQSFEKSLKEIQRANETTFSNLKKRSMDSIDALFNKSRINERLNSLVNEYSIKVAELNGKIALVNEETPAQTRDKLESLDGDERLDVSAIRGIDLLEKEIKKVKERPIPVPRAPYLWNLVDVDVSGILVGQAIKWDGVRWIPYTPVGGNTSVYNEVVSGSATTFTLAHTPVSTTVRVYALGQRLSPTTDYSLVGATITTVSSWEAGDITSDYEY